MNITKKDLIIIALVVVVTLGAVWTFNTLTKPVESQIDYSPYIKQRDQLLDSIAKLQVSYKNQITKLKKQYEIIDTVTVAGVDADIANFKLRATKPAPRFR